MKKVGPAVLQLFTNEATSKARQESKKKNIIVAKVGIEMARNLKTTPSPLLGSIASRSMTTAKNALGQTEI